MIPCPVCKNPAIENPDRRYGDHRWVSCATCGGDLELAGTYFSTRSYITEPIPGLSAILRFMFDNGQEVKQINEYYVNELLSRHLEMRS